MALPAGTVHSASGGCAMTLMGSGAKRSDSGRDRPTRARRLRRAIQGQSVCAGKGQACTVFSGNPKEAPPARRRHGRRALYERPGDIKQATEGAGYRGRARRRADCHANGRAAGGGVREGASWPPGLEELTSWIIPCCGTTRGWLRHRARQLVEKVSRSCVCFPHTYQVRDFAPKLPPAVSGWSATGFSSGSKMGSSFSRAALQAAERGHRVPRRPRTWRHPGGAHGWTR